MMTDELIMMLDKFEAGTGKPPTKIICGEAAFEKLRRMCTAARNGSTENYVGAEVYRTGRTGGSF